jgi:probable phosphoglycerate mutase
MVIPTFARSAGRAAREMLLVCRHGETEANKEHIIQGQSESDLTATGRAQAAALGQELSRRIGGGGAGSPPLALTVYSSDLRRARDTAQAAVDALIGAGVVPAGALRLATDERLRERRLGALQGRTAKESRGRWPQLWRAFQSDDGGAAAPCSSEPGADENGGIESADEVRRRAGAALAEIAAAHAGQRVVVVSHGGCIHSAIMAVCTNLNDVAHIGNCSITTLVPGAGLLPWACHGPDDAFLPEALGVAATNADVSRSCPNPSEVPKA